jgi:hypothetical protein
LAGLRLMENLSLNSICYAVRSPTSEDDGVRYFVAGLINVKRTITYTENLHLRVCSVNRVYSVCRVDGFKKERIPEFRDAQEMPGVKALKLGTLRWLWRSIIFHQRLPLWV